MKKCMSMHQPWASLLVAGIKKHEGRSWYSSHRGIVLPKIRINLIGMIFLGDSNSLLLIFDFVSQVVYGLRPLQSPLIQLKLRLWRISIGCTTMVS